MLTKALSFFIYILCIIAIMNQKRFCVELSAGKMNTLRNMILNIDKMKRSNFCSLNLLIRSFKRVQFDLIPCVSESQVISQCEMVQCPTSCCYCTCACIICRMN